MLQRISVSWHFYCPVYRNTSCSCHRRHRIAIVVNYLSVALFSVDNANLVVVTHYVAAVFCALGAVDRHLQFMRLVGAELEYTFWTERPAPDNEEVSKREVMDVWR